jgi:NAD(P)-dependent dehydrogenase (short-subunit alcohol dehydrogenase family)
VGELTGKVAVVTGGASGIGAGLVEALLEADADVVVADVEQPVLDETVRQLGDHYGHERLTGIVTDVSRPESTEACARQVYERHGRCHYLFNNAGVGGGGVAKPWNWTPNDWKWCFGVNLFGAANCVGAFVPRMLEGGEEGWVVNTSSSNGGYQPMADLAIYAASKAGLTTYTECLANGFAEAGSSLHAAIFYPGGKGLLETRLWNSGRNRPPELAREHPHIDAQWDYQEVKARVLANGGQIADLVDQGRAVLRGLAEGRFIIAADTASVGELMRRRAERISTGGLPTVEEKGVFS